MDESPAYWHRRLNGVVEIEELPREKWKSGRADEVIIKRLLCTWRPPYQLTEEVPEGFSLSLECHVNKDGTRRFTPAEQTANFIFHASLGGHAILRDRDGIKKHLPLSYDEFRLFNQHIRHRREYFGSTIKLEQAFYVASAGRPDRGTSHILPPDLGLDSQGEGQVWRVPTLFREGLGAAQAAGLANPTPAEIMRYGLMTAAQRSPLVVSNVKAARGLVRMTLFALGPAAEKIKPSAITYVANQVKAALAQFTATNETVAETREKFDRWIVDEKSNLIHQISKRSDCRLGRAGVREALLELGWLSFEAMGRSIDAQMQAFREALPEPLSPTEDVLFSQVFLAHRAFGNLPMILLQDRFKFLQEAFLQTWQRPDNRSDIAVVHKMMDYYSVLVGNRRSGYREYKSHTKAKNESGCVARTEVLLPDAKIRTSPQSEEFKEIAIRLAKARGFRCDFESAEWEAEPVSRIAEMIGFRIICPAYCFDETLSVPREEFDAMRQRIEGE